MLRLNPGDNQGLRSALVSKLLELDDLEGAEKLLKDYKEPDFAEWSFNKALLLFKQQGPAALTTSKALKAAHKNNPHATPMLLEEKPIPNTLPAGYSLGSKEEAVIYVLGNIQNWNSTKGALQWLHETTKNTRPKPK